MQGPSNAAIPTSTSPLRNPRAAKLAASPMKTSALVPGTGAYLQLTDLTATRETVFKGETLRGVLRGEARPYRYGVSLLGAYRRA